MHEQAEPDGKEDAPVAKGKEGGGAVAGAAGMGVVGWRRSGSVQVRAVDADCDVFARAAAAFPSGTAPPLVAAVRGSHSFLADAAADITAALTSITTAARNAAVGAVCNKNIVQEASKPHDNSDGDEGAGGEGGSAMRGIVGLLPF